MVKNSDKSLQKMVRLAIIIPAFEPDKTLVSLLSDLAIIYKADDDVDVTYVVVDDGSIEQSSRAVFEKVARLSDAILLKHKVNKGKGAALKTGIEYAQNGGFAFACTADADGQHLATDIKKISDHVIETGIFTIGSREFDKSVPARSRFGNLITSRLFSLIFKIQVTDTQSGLRAFPARYYSELSKIKSNGYEYEFQMLIDVSKYGDIDQVKIETIYEPGNPSSHFRPLLDSGLIYLVFLRYVMFVPIIALMDFGCFTLLSKYMEPALAFGFVRSVTVIVYFFAMREFVFASRKSTFLQPVQYLLLVMLNVAFAGVLFLAPENSLVLTPTVIYVVCTLALFVLNFMIQRYVIFKT